MKTKIRMKNWYWGNFMFAGEMMDSSKVSLKNKDFEPYIESVHGWHNSEEWKQFEKMPYNEKSFNNFSEVLNGHNKVR